MRSGVVLAVSLAAALAGREASAQSAADGRTTSWLQRRLETGLQDALGGSVRIGRLDVNWTTLSATVGDVAISIPADDAPPLIATIDEGRLQLSWSGLSGLAGGDVHITEIVARGATFSCSREWIDAWRPKKESAGRAVAIQIDRLVVDNASAEYVDAGHRVRVRTRSMSFRGDWSASRRLLVGEVQADTTVEAPIFSRPWPATVRGGLRVGLARLEIFAATGEGPGAHAELSGLVSWGAGASFTAEGRLAADLSLMSPYLAGHAALAGQVEGPLQIVYTGGVPIRVTVQARTTGFHVGRIATEQANAEITIRPSQLDVSSLEARAYGGAFTGSLGLSFGPTLSISTDLSGRGANLAQLIALSGAKLPIACAADVTFKIEGDPVSPATWRGGGSFDAPRFVPAQDDRIPTKGRGRLTFDSGRVRVDAQDLALAEASLRLTFDAEIAVPASGIHVALDGTTQAAGTTQRAALKLLDALGVRPNAIAAVPLQGQGRIRAEVRTGRAARFTLDLDLGSGSWSGEPFDSAVLDLEVGDDAVVIRRAELTGGPQSVSGQARFDLQTGALDDVDVTARGIGIAKLLTSAGMPAPVDGLCDLRLSGFRENGAFAADGHVRATNVIVGREIVDSVDGPVRVEGGRVILDGLYARGQGAEARALVTYDIAKGEADVELESAKIDIASNRTLAEAGLTARGKLRAQGSLTITKEGPSGQLSLAADELLLDTGRSGLKEIRLGDLQGTGTLSPQGIEIAVRSMPDAAWTFDANLGFSSKLPLSAVLYFEDLVVGAGGVFGESVDLRLKGQVQAEGDLTEPRAMEINGAFDEVTVRLGPSVFRAAAPFPLRLDSGRFTLGPSRFVGDAASLELSGSGSIEGGEVAGYLRGTIDLAVVSSLWSEVRGAGPLEIDATLGGTFDRPDLRGRVAVHDGRLRLIGYPQSLESIDAEAAFDGQALRLTSFHAFQGGGEVSATGEVEFAGLAPKSFRAVFDGANVTATFPEGFRGTYQGRIVVEGTPKRATISGRVEVVWGLYTKDFDVGLFGGAHREFDAAAESPFPRNIFLDVDIVAPGNVWLRNDLAKLEAQGQIHLSGELARPVVTGRFAFVPGGRVRYRDVEYLIEYGTVEQTDPKRINPYVDFRGRTRVAEYDIWLHVEGTVDKFEYELTSTPPLASQDIISLLVTGKTLDSLSGSASASALPADMAAYYFAGLLTSTFGKQIQSSLGIDQLAVTPLLIKGESDPTARVTVGKQVSDTVKILFSQDIGTAQKQTYQVSWDLSRRVRLIAESDTESGVGGEFQYSRQFGGTPVGEKAVPASALPGQLQDLPGTVASVEVLADDETSRSDLVKLAKIRAGDVFERGHMLQGGDRIRAALVKKGFVQAIVRAEAKLEAGPPPTYRIRYRVTTGPSVVLELVMSDGKGKRRVKKALKEFQRITPYTPDFWPEATRALVDELQQNGYYAADVTWHASDTPSGRTVRILVDRGQHVRLRAVRFSGIVSIPRERIDKQVTSLKSQGLRKPLLRPSVLAADLAAVRALYREEGFTRVRIGVPQISLSTKGDSAEVDVAIQEGPRFAVGDITFSEEVAATDAQLHEWTPITTGETFSPRRLAEAEQTLSERFDELGYPNVNVESHVDLEGETADIAFDIATGSRQTVGDIAIAGNKVTRDKTIAKALTFSQGDLLSGQSLLESQQRLYRTGLFSSVRLTSAPLGGDDPVAQRVTVAVEEAPPLTFGFGVGYDSTSGPRASVLVGYSNLGGRNVSGALQGLVSEKENRALLTLRRRRVFGKMIDSLGSLLFEKTVKDSFTESRDSIAIRLEQRPKLRWIRFVRYSIQEVAISDVTDAQAALEEAFNDKLSNVRLADLGLGLVRDTRDDAFLPTRGGYGSIETSVFAKPLGSQESFAKLFLRGSWTASLGRAGRFATFLRIGLEQPFADTELVPLSERFFAGGANTLRGFATDSVLGLLVCSVPKPAGTPADLPVTVWCPAAGGQLFNTGGEALLLLNQEWHFPIWRSLWGEIFLDAGNVYATISDFDVTDLRSSAGTGLRLATPIGAIRVEYGWKLDRRPGESGGEIVFAIGAVF